MTVTLAAHRGTLLFVVNEAGEFVELQRVAAAAKHHGYDIHFYFAQPGYVNLRHDRTICRFLGFRDYYPGKKIRLSKRELFNIRESERLDQGYLPHSMIEKRTTPSRMARMFGLALVPLLQLPVAIAAAFRRFTRRIGYADAPLTVVTWSKPYRYAVRLLKYVRPDVVIYGQDFPGSVNSFMTKWCKRRNISTMIVPFAVGTTKEMVESLADKPAHDADSTLINRVAARLYPHWLNYYGTKRLLRLPGKNILVLEALGVVPEHPWLPNSSAVDAIAVESHEAARYYDKLHFNTSQVRLTGSTYDDRLIQIRSAREQAKTKLYRRLQLDRDKRLLVCAWPTDQFGSRFIPLEFSNYLQLCRAWAEELQRVARESDFNVVIRPHPVTDPAFLGDVLRPYRLHRRVTMISTLELVAVSDLFLACVSSTLRWAIASGIPAVNYDCYDYGYRDFDSAGGVFTVKRYEDFEAIMEQLTTDTVTYERAAMAQVQTAQEWGMHDGQSTARILTLLDDLADSTRRRGVIQSLTQAPRIARS